MPQPRFILRCTDFTILDVSQDREVQRELDADDCGYGIISYTWGRFQVKTERETSLIAPKFDLKIPADMQWHIPKVTYNSNTRQGFTIEQVHNVIQKLNMKYVWWDWACIPQYWNDGPKDPKPSSNNDDRPYIGYLDPKYHSIKNEEIAKQSFIYTMAKKGILWLHDTTWVERVDPATQDPSQSQRDAQNQSDLQKLLFLDMDSKFLWGNKTRFLWNLWSRFVSSPNSKMEMNQYLTLLQSVKQNENWFSSLWTFQEGILLNTVDFVDPRSGEYSSERPHSAYAQLADKDGNFLKSPIDSFFRNSATILDITGRVTIHACTVAAMLSAALAADDQAKVNTYSDWLRQLYETGFVSYVAGSPLITIETGKARGGSFSRPEDYCVNALLGALQVTLPPSVDFTNLEAMQLAFLSVLVQRYKWNMTLLSKPTTGSSQLQSVASGQGDWRSIVGQTWNFTSLGAFIISTLGDIRPPKKRKEGGSVMKPVQFSNDVLAIGGTARRKINIPSISHMYSIDPSSRIDALVVKPQAQTSIDKPYGFYIYGKAAAKASPPWSACRFYASKAAVGESRKKSHCLVRPVKFSEAFTVFGADAFALLPLEDVSVTAAKDPNAQIAIVRCVILQSFRKGVAMENGMAAGIFLGIGDFQFGGDVVESSVADELSSPDWTIYMY